MRATGVPKGDHLGEFEQCILATVIRLAGNAYGVTIRRELTKRTDRNVSLGAVYATLDRLEQKGFVSSYSGDPTPERGGRAKRYYRIEGVGEIALSQSWQMHDRVREGIILVKRGRGMVLGERLAWPCYGDYGIAQTASTSKS